MDRNLELAEMVVNKEINLEEAMALTDDVDDLLEKIKLRKSMKYAMMSMITWNRMKLLSKDITSLSCSMNAYKGWVKRYAQQAAKLLEKHKQIEEQQLQDAYWRWGAEWISEDVEESLNRLENESAWMIEEANESLERSKELQFRIESKKQQIEMFRRSSQTYAISSIIQAIGEIFETIGDSLLS